MCRFSGTKTEPPRPEALTWSRKLRLLFTGTPNPRPENIRTPRDLGLSFETKRIQGPNGALELWVIETPDPRATVLGLHGYSEAKQQLLDLVEPFQKLRLNVVLVDFYGSGGSSGKATTIGYREARDVKAAADGARARFPGSPLVVYGVSMGGAAALEAIRSHGVKPDAVVLEGVFTTLLEATKMRFKLLGVPAFPLAHVLLFWGGVVARFNPFAFRPVDAARRVRCPALVFRGGADDRVTPEQARRLFDRLPGLKRFSEFPRVPHVKLVQPVHPEKWKGEMVALLDTAGQVEPVSNVGLE